MGVSPDFEVIIGTRTVDVEAAGEDLSR